MAEPRNNNRYVCQFPPNSSDRPAVRVFSNVDVDTAYANLVEVISVMEKLMGPPPPSPVEQVSTPVEFESPLEVTSSSSDHNETVDESVESVLSMSMQPPKARSPFGEPKVSSSTTANGRQANPKEITAYFHGISSYMVQNHIDEATFKAIKIIIDCLLKSGGGGIKALGNPRF